MSDESGFGSEPKQGLDDSEGEEFSVVEFWCDTDSWPFGRPMRMFDKQIVNRDVESGRESVQVSVHAESSKTVGVVKTPILDALARSVVDTRRTREPLGTDHLGEGA